MHSRRISALHRGERPSKAVGCGSPLKELILRSSVSSFGKPVPQRAGSVPRKLLLEMCKAMSSGSWAQLSGSVPAHVWGLCLSMQYRKACNMTVLQPALLIRPVLSKQHRHVVQHTAVREGGKQSECGALIG